MMKLLRLYKTGWLLAGCIVLGHVSRSQISITGQTCTVQGGSSGYQYAISGNWLASDNLSWTISGGTIAGSGNTTLSGTISSIGTRVFVNWSSSSGSVSVTNSRLGSYTLNVNSIAFNNTLTPPAQTVSYGSSTTVSGGGPTSSSCTPSYLYWWESGPTSSGPFSTEAGQSGQNLTINAIAKAYYRRVLSFNGDNLYSNVVVIDITPLSAGTLSTSNHAVNYNAQPSVSQTSASGGFCSSYTYEWQRSVEGGPWTVIGSGAAYPSGAPAFTGNTKVRRKVMCGNQILFTNELAFTVNYNSSNAENLNYVRSNDIRLPLINSFAEADQLSVANKQQITQYADGLGRSIQTVNKQLTPLQKDLVSIKVYDSLGRESIQYLPYAASTNDGKFKTSPLTEQNSFNSAQFPGETYYYNKLNFEASPISRVLGTFPAGINWVGASKGVTSQFLANAASDSVRIWTIDSAIRSIPVSSQIYDVGQLYKTITTDEQNHQVIEYKDKEGQVVLKKVQLSDSPGSAHVGWLCTYYVYDDLNQLRFVISPKAVELINGSWSISQTVADELCFRYEYDWRQRMAIKKVPGAGEVWMVYDARDRLVLTQDSSYRALGRWAYTQYDSLNRPFATGLTFDTHTQDYNAQQARNSIAYPNLAIWGYALLSHTFFDNYSWLPDYPTPFAATRSTAYDSYFYSASNTVWPYPQPLTQSAHTRGLITGKRIGVFEAGQLLYRIIYYDEKERVIQEMNTNITGSTDVVTSQYNFSGQPLMKFLYHYKGGTLPNTDDVITKIEYDSSGRVKNLLKSMDHAADELIAGNKYNELGQLKVKTIGNGIDSMVYDYNIRGWLTGINKGFLSSGAGNYFAMELAYDKTASVIATTSYSASQFNGNITGITWKTKGDGIARKYDFEYDNVNRFIKANYLQNTSGSTWENSSMNYTVGGIDSDNGYRMKYDANGNILNMVQYGFKIGSPAGIIDGLRYTYQSNSNKLKQVQDDNNDLNSKLGDFKYDSATKTATDYTYDGLGNLVTDNNKHITSIAYNYENLPTTITVAGKGTIVYLYDAEGNKIKKTVTDTTVHPTKVSSTLYIAGFVYENDTLKFTTHEEGRVRYPKHYYLNGSTANKWEYDYFLKDHLGNVRMVLTQQKDTSAYLATLESTYRNTERQLFGKIDSIGYARSLVSGYPADVSVTNPNDSVMRLNGNGPKTGASLLLKVMSGDKIDVATQFYYNSMGSPNSPANSFNDVLNSLATGIMGATAGAKGSLSDLTNSSTGPLYSALTTFFNNNISDTTGKPRAYLNWMLVDEQFKYVSSYPQSGAIRVGAAGASGTQLQFPLSYSAIPITKNGYLYVWVSNETPGWDVFFDNLSVRHFAGPLLEETHYYPFGLTMAGISSKALKGNYVENKRGFNGGNELQSKEFSDESGLEEYDAIFRRYDAQIGRWHSVDPLIELGEDVSPYAFADNNPLSFHDPLGLSTQGYVYDSTKKSITYDPDVHNQNDVAPNSGLKYLGERIVTTDASGNKTWWDENGNSSSTDPQWGNLEAVTVTGTKGNNSGRYNFLFPFLNTTLMPTGPRPGQDGMFGLPISSNHVNRLIRDAGIITSGLPLLSKRFVMPGATRRTSIASILLRRIIPSKWTVKGTLGEKIGAVVARRLGTNGLGAAAGRTVPIIGWGMLLIDIHTMGNDLIDEIGSDAEHDRIKDSPVNTNTAAPFGGSGTSL